MSFKKSLIIGASVLTLAPIASATMVSENISANEINSNQVQENIDIEKLDTYVSLDEDSLEYQIDSEAQNKLSEDEYLFLTERVKETNSQLNDIVLADNESMQVEGKKVTITQTVSSKDTNSSNVSLRSAFSEGVNKIEKYWWGYRVWLSKTTINNIGDGITFAGFFFPEQFLARVINASGFLLGKAPGGIVFNTSPKLASFVPGMLGKTLYFWGPSFQ